MYSSKAMLSFTIEINKKLKSSFQRHFLFIVVMSVTSKSKSDKVREQLSVFKHLRNGRSVYYDDNRERIICDKMWKNNLVSWNISSD